MTSPEDFTLCTDFLKKRREAAFGSEVGERFAASGKDGGRGENIVRGTTGVV